MVSGIAAPVALSTSASHATTSAAEAQLIVNGSFESGTSGWETARNRQVLTATRPSVSGAASARLKATAGSRVALKTTMPAVDVADPASTYTVTAFVRSTGASFPGRLRVREYVGNKWVDQHGVERPWHGGQSSERHSNRHWGKHGRRRAFNAPECSIE